MKSNLGTVALTACVNTQEAQNTEIEISRDISRSRETYILAYHEPTCTILFNLFLIFLLIVSVMFIVVNKVNSKHSQISRMMINSQGRVLIFKEFQVPLKNHFKF